MALAPVGMTSMMARVWPGARRGSTRPHCSHKGPARSWRATIPQRGLSSCCSPSRSVQSESLSPVHQDDQTSQLPSKRVRLGCVPSEWLQCWWQIQLVCFKFTHAKCSSGHLTSFLLPASKMGTRNGRVSIWPILLPSMYQQFKTKHSLNK